ncbi:translin [Moesziomyces antarcticus]|uniref:Translin n=1 Tax=Pseudozyma antarctica TaxID=84753 RepID=A0A081CLS6_PSEA2|nr:translin [Moesziomyces antarcticus]GAK67622.1 translin [Moesziomyces antarcticus]
MSDQPALKRPSEPSDMASGSTPTKRLRSDASPAAAAASLLEAFGLFRDEIDDYNDRRERLIKTSRDVTSLSKKVIFLLHRFDVRDFASTPSLATQKLLEEAESKLNHIVGVLEQAAKAEELALPERHDRHERNIGGGLEEFIEALSFYHYLETTNLITLEQIQERFGDVLKVPIHRYLLGLSDLTGELMRFATNAVGQGDTGKVVQHVLGITRCLHDTLDPFIPLVNDLRKKQAVTKQSLQKIEHSTSLPIPLRINPRKDFPRLIRIVETVLYAITVRKAEFAADPKALQEMLRRSLDSSAPPPTDQL